MADRRFKVTLPEGFELTADHRKALETPHREALDEVEARADAMVVTTEHGFVVVRNVIVPTESMARWKVTSRVGLDHADERVLVDEDPE